VVGKAVLLSFGLACLGLVGTGCGSGDSGAAETKASGVSVQLTPEQQAYQSGPGQDPNYDPSEAAHQSGKK
jgi:hypothetical protein